MAAMTLAGSAQAVAPPRAGQIEKQLESVKAVVVASPAKGIIRLRQIGEAAARLENARDRKLAQAAVLRLQAEANLRLNRADQAKTTIDQALAIVSPLAPKSALMADVLLSSGGVHAMLGDVASALRSYQTAYKLFTTLGDERNQLLTLVYIATLYNEARDNEKALTYFKQALELPNKDLGLVIAIYNNLGLALQDLERFNEANTAFQRSLVVATRIKSLPLQARIWGSIARNQLKAGETHLAEQAIRKGLMLAEAPSVAGERPDLLAISAEAALRRGQTRRAGALLDRSFAGVELSATTPPQREAHDTAYRAYAALGNVDRALAHLRALKRIDDEATKLAITSTTALMGARFDYANQELRIAKLKATELRRSIAFEQARARSERMMFLTLGAATLLVIVLLAIGLFTLRRSRDQVRVANADLEVTNAALAKALAAKTEFLATTSHEIRTPLNGILGMTEVMLLDATLTRTQRERLRLVHDAGQTMKVLVDDILDVAKMENGRLEIEEAAFDLRATLDDCARLWSAQAAAKGLAFHADLDGCPTAIVGDAVRVRQIVANLLGNAVKFTAQGAVRLSARISEGGGEVMIGVTDSGIGIAADQQDAVFELFHQADASTTRLFGGTGLGLAISRRLAHAMHGNVTVASMPGQGSTFVLSMPLRVAEAPVVVACEAVKKVVPGLLIVDRNPIMRAMWRSLLEERAGDIAFVATANEAIAWIDRSAVTAVLVDQPNIGDESGTIFALVQTGAPVTVLLPGQDMGAAAGLLAAGVAHVIAKPARGADVVAALFGETDAPALVSQAS